MLTPKDLENPARKSGYDHVNSAVAGPLGRSTGTQLLWRARGSWIGSNAGWSGKTRKIALEAAQDYCDYVNSGKAPKVPAPSKPPKPARTPLLLNRAAHPAPVRPVTVKTRRRKAPTFTANEPGFVYLVGVQGEADYAKIGWSNRPNFSRLRGLQTGNPHLLVGVAERPGTKAAEYALHVAHESANVLNEWFWASPELVAEFDLTWNQFAAAVGDIYAIDTEAA